MNIKEAVEKIQDRLFEIKLRKDVLIRYLETKYDYPEDQKELSMIQKEEIFLAELRGLLSSDNAAYQRSSNTKFRRATSNLIIKAPEIPEEKKSEIEVPTELESLILSHFPRQKKMPKKVKNLLNSPVVTRGKSFDSPEQMWENSGFKKWISSQLKWYASEGTSPNLYGAIYIVRGYGAEKYGWIDYNESKNRQNLDTSESKNRQNLDTSASTNITDIEPEA